MLHATLQPWLSPCAQDGAPHHALPAATTGTAPRDCCSPYIPLYPVCVPVRHLAGLYLACPAILRFVCQGFIPRSQGKGHGAQRTPLDAAVVQSVLTLGLRTAHQEHGALLLLSSLIIFFLCLFFLFLTVLLPPCWAGCMGPGRAALRSAPSQLPSLVPCTAAAFRELWLWISPAALRGVPCCSRPDAVNKRVKKMCIFRTGAVAHMWSLSRVCPLWLFDMQNACLKNKNLQRSAQPKKQMWLPCAAGESRKEKQKKRQHKKQQNTGWELRAAPRRARCFVSHPMAQH